MSRGTVWSKMKLVRAASWCASRTSVCAARGEPSSPTTFHVGRCGSRLRSHRVGPPWRSCEIATAAAAATAPAGRRPRSTAAPASAEAAQGTPIGAK
jgi:hypothetical protein